MANLTSPKEIRQLMNRFGLHFHKSLGQNFLIDDNILNKIILGAEISAEDYILEIGPGIGTMTRALAEKAKKVVAVEIDKNLIPALNETLAEFANVRLIHGDILKVDIGELIQQEFDGCPFKVVANLPYYVTTPIIMSFLESDYPWHSIVVMVQREVAERMKAAPGTKDYGTLSVAVQYRAQPSIILKAPSTVFMPPPKVDSVVIRLDSISEPPVQVRDERLFFELVKAAFAKRRKTMVNALSSFPALGITREETISLLSSADIAGERRGETLSLGEFAELTNRLVDLKNQ